MILDFVPIINTTLHVKNCSNRTIHYNGDGDIFIQKIVCIRNFTGAT